MLGSWLGLNGQLSEYVFIDMPGLANNTLQVFFLLSIIFSAMFGRAFLGTRSTQPWSDRYLPAARQLAPGKRPELAPEQVPLVQELIIFLRRKDTHADQLIAQLKDELGTRTGDAASTWLQAVAAEVDALDYEGALDLLAHLGWNEA